MFGYGFVDLTSEEKRLRRVQLDWHATYAQISVVVVLLLVQITILLLWALDRWIDRQTLAVPKSPHLPPRAQKSSASLRQARHAVVKLRWWMETPVLKTWGTRGSWICGLSWSVWMLYLCVRNTAPDYFHLTKRFGIVAAALLPFQYLLAMRSSYSPVQLLMRLGHEELKGSHMILGKITTTFFTLHGLFYLNYYVQKNLLWDKMQALVPVLGMFSLTLWIILSTSALSFTRQWSYRLFYILHASLAWLILPPMYFHVHHIRPYIYQTLAVVTLLNVLRVFRTRTYAGEIKIIPGTDLVRVRIPLSSDRERSRWKPGQHVYLSRPTGRNLSVHELFVRLMHVNPFTVASIAQEDGELILVARTLKGSTKLTSDLAKSLAKDEAAGKKAKALSLTIEGPYGGVGHIPDLSRFEKVLFIAGGVGATFIIPLYRAALASASTRSTPDIRLVWAVRSMAETTWALPIPKMDATAQSLIELYITGKRTASNGHAVVSQSTDGVDDIEMTEGEHLLGEEEVADSKVEHVHQTSGRPDISRLVDDTMADVHGKVAIFVCGPTTLSHTTRNAVASWVYRGADVYFKEEAFGY